MPLEVHQKKRMSGLGTERNTGKARISPPNEDHQVVVQWDTGYTGPSLLDCL